jgi:hypothetical protein
MDIICHALLICIEFITLMICVKSMNYEAAHYAVFLTLLFPLLLCLKFLFKTLTLDVLSPFSSITVTILDIIHRPVSYLKTRLVGDWILSPTSGVS